MPPAPVATPTGHPKRLRPELEIHKLFFTGKDGDGFDRTALIGNGSTPPTSVRKEQIPPKAPAGRDNPALSFSNPRSRGRKNTLSLISSADAARYAVSGLGSGVKFIDFAAASKTERNDSEGMDGHVLEQSADTATVDLVPGKTAKTLRHRPSMIPVRKSYIGDSPGPSGQTVHGSTSTANPPLAKKEVVPKGTSSKRYTAVDTVPGGRHTAERAFLRRMSLPLTSEFPQASRAASKKAGDREVRLRAAKIADRKAAGIHAILLMEEEEINNHPEIIKDRELLYAPDEPQPYYPLPDIMHVKQFDDW
jgi:hypothetical protein